MRPVEIKILIMRQGETITSLAEKFGCLREELSQCIRQVRVYPELRGRLARELGTTVEALFSEPKKRKQSA